MKAGLDAEREVEPQPGVDVVEVGGTAHDHDVCEGIQWQDFPPEVGMLLS